MIDENIVTILEASKALQDKVGTGTVPQSLIDSLQKKLEDPKIDFEPMALLFLAMLDKALKAASNNSNTVEDSTLQELYQQIANPVMQLKANASMFGYPLISEMSETVLNLIEVKSICNQDTIDLTYGLYKALEAVITHKMKGDGGLIGRTLKSELDLAANRYAQKMQI